MMKLNLTELQTQEIAEALDDPRTTDRAKTKLLAIRMHSLGMPHGKIAAALNISDDTVTNSVKSFRKGGVAQLIENRHFRPTSSVEPFLQEITDSLTHCPVATAKEGAHRIKEITGIELSEDQARRIMKRIGLAYRKTAAIPGGVDPQIQFTFLQDELIPRLEGAREGNRRVFSLMPPPFDSAARNDIGLLFLTAYSPNLNLIERVWRLVKYRSLRNKYFPDFASFRASIDSFLDSLCTSNRQLLKSLVTENFQTFETPSL